MCFFYEDAEQMKLALERAAKAHHEYELTLGSPDKEWADWYSKFMLTENVSFYPMNFVVADVFDVPDYHTCHMGRNEEELVACIQQVEAYREMA
jgi:hypothetical protein